MEVYFDNGATTKPFEEVIDEVSSTMRNCCGNPSSAHSLGLIAEKKLTESRDIISRSMGCLKEEIVFTSGGSESNNLLIKGFLSTGNHAITTCIEHPSVLNCFKELEKSGVKVTYLDVDSYGRIDLEQLEKSINSDTRLVSVMHVNNETGIIQDIETIGKIIKEKSSRVKFHVDAVQGFGKIKLDIKKAQVDLLSASAHKIHGPRGTGIAYIKKGLMPKALINGGGQEKGVRSGTENLPAIAGMALAVEKMFSCAEENYSKILKVKKYFIDKLQQIEGVFINSPDEECFSPYVLNAAFSGIRAEVMLHMLEAQGIYVSNGSACSSKDAKVSHVLKSVQLHSKYIQGAIRFSFNGNNTTEEVDYVVDQINKSLKFLRRK